MLKKILSAIFLIFGFAITCFGQVNTVTENFPHWKNPAKLTVFIPQDTNSAMMKRAFIKWQNESFGNVKFVFKEKVVSSNSILPCFVSWFPIDSIILNILFSAIVAS